MNDDTNEVNIDTETTEDQKKLIEEIQDENRESIVEVDEAAGAAEGMTNREENPLSEDVSGDRESQ